MMTNAPPFDGSPAQSREDYCTEAGARRLGHMIAEAWLKHCGVRLKFSVEGVGLGLDGRFACYAPRFPQLVNGLYQP